MSKRMNKLQRHTATLKTKVKKIEREPFLKKEIPHKAYGSVFVVVDENVKQRIDFATNALKISRNIPIFSQAAELAVTDPYVMFYRGEQFQDEEGNHYYSLQEAQSRAMKAYIGDGGPISVITSDAALLAFVHYTDFEGSAPDIDDDFEETNAERKEYGLPPYPKRDKFTSLERKLDHVHFMVQTDADFAKEFQAAIQEAVAKAQEQGTVEEEETSDEGFPTEPTS